MNQTVVRRLTSTTILFFSLIFIGANALAQSLPSYPNDIRPGSVLFFTRYTSNGNSPQQCDSQVSITNVNAYQSAEIHMFLVDGASCTVADFFLSLTPNQTTSFLMSDWDPGVQGYVVAVATSGGTPAQFNSLIGTVYIREQDGRQAVLPAITVSKISAGPIQQKMDGTYSLLFNGAEYERLPSSLALSNFNSPVTSQGYLLLISPTSDLTFGAVNSINIFTLLYDDKETPFSSSISVSCILYSPLSVVFGRGGLISRVVPAGRTGWARFTATSKPILGSFLMKDSVFQGGHNLPALALLSSYEMTLPVF